MPQRPTAPLYSSLAILSGSLIAFNCYLTTRQGTRENNHVAARTFYLGPWSLDTPPILKDHRRASATRDELVRVPQELEQAS